VEQFRIVGGHPALDLVNTVAPRVAGAGAVADLFQAPSDLLAWARRVDLLTTAEAAGVRAAWDADPAFAARTLEAVIDVREALYRILKTIHDQPTPGTSGPPGIARDLDRLGLRWAAAAARTTLALGSPAEPPVRAVVGTAPATVIADRLAVAAVEFLRALERSQLGECPVADGGCGWLFLDRSRNRSRRWCTMEDCGAHAKARRLTARRQARRATT
jgi:predicted RNA-binding Zn ribbon-like protein